MKPSGTPQPDLPPGPRTSPVIQLLRWMRRPVAFMQECSQRYGETFTVRLAGFPPLVFFSNSEDIRAILAGDAELMDCGRFNCRRGHWGCEKKGTSDQPSPCSFFHSPTDRAYRRNSES
jgi:cytochrome P450